MVKLILLYKTFKTARLAIADRTILNYTNTEFLMANTQKKRQIEYTEIQNDNQNACVLSLEDVQKRKPQVVIKKKDKKAKKLIQKKK